MNKYTLIAYKPHHHYSGSWGYSQDYAAYLKIYINKTLDEVIDLFEAIALMNFNQDPEDIGYGITVLYNNHVFYAEEAIMEYICPLADSGCKTVEIKDLNESEYIQFCLFAEQKDNFIKNTLPEKIKEYKDTKEKEEKQKKENEARELQSRIEETERQQLERLKKKYEKFEKTRNERKVL